MTAFRLASALDRRLSSRLAIPPRSGRMWFTLRLLSHSGDSLLWVLGAGAAMVCAGEIGWQVGWRILGGTLFPGTVVIALKGLFRHRRPPLGPYPAPCRDPDAAASGQKLRVGARLLALDRYSFPSGHAARATCVVFLLAPLLPATLAATMAVWAGLVGLARVSLQIHFLSDVVFGWLVGMAVGALLWAVI